MKEENFNREKLRYVLQKAKTSFERISSWFFTHTAKDKHWVLIILILSALLRVPFLDHPNRTAFDEIVYINFTLHIMHEEPFFDIHPPLARMIFAGIASNTNFTLWGLPMRSSRQFSDFPYETLRLFIAMIGTLIPLLLYLIGRLLKYRPTAAGILALFAVFDTTLVIYSRFILPDTILLFLNFLGFAAALAAAQTTQRKSRILLIILSGVAVGFAVSIKWTALAMLPIVGMIYFFARMYRTIFFVTLLVASTYVLVFVLYLSNFTQGGRIDPALFPYKKPWATEMTFPKGTNTKEVFAFLPQMHNAMLRANTDADIAKMTLQSSGPLSWPAARSSIVLWLNNDGPQSIILRGNEFLWVLTFFMVLFEFFWIDMHAFTKRTWPIDKTETLLVLGYICNYAPFFFIHRPMYLYHYLTAFIFLLLLIPRVTPRIITCIEEITHDRALAQTIMYLSIALVLINFILLSPTTYGF